MPTYSVPTADFVTTSLSGVLAAGATSATIGTGLNLPATNGVLTVSYDTANAVGATDGPETISYTSYTSGTGALAGLTRGLAGTTDVQHSSGQSVQSSFSSLNATGTLGYAEITTAFSTTSYNTTVDVTGLTTTVTVPSGGRRIKITAYSTDLRNNNAADTPAMDFMIREGSTTLALSSYLNRGNNVGNGVAIAMASFIPTAGSHTYKVSLGIANVSGTTQVSAYTTSPAFILVELI